jgi:hypothetical protein
MELRMSEDRDLYMNPEQLLAGVSGGLRDIVGYLRQGQAVPPDLIDRGNRWWRILDDHVPIADSPLAYPLEGAGNLLRKILYDLEHNRPIDDETLAAVDSWEQEIGQMHLPQPDQPAPDRHA